LFHSRPAEPISGLTSPPPYYANLRSPGLLPLCYRDLPLLPTAFSDPCLQIAQFCLLLSIKSPTPDVELGRYTHPLRVLNFAPPFFSVATLFAMHQQLGFTFASVVHTRSGVPSSSTPRLTLEHPHLSSDIWHFLFQILFLPCCGSSCFSSAHRPYDGAAVFLSLYGLTPSWCSPFFVPGNRNFRSWPCHGVIVILGSSFGWQSFPPGQACPTRLIGACFVIQKIFLICLTLLLYSPTRLVPLL